MIKENQKKIISSHEVKELGVISEGFRRNTTMKNYKVEQYYYDSRYQTLLYRKVQYPLLVVVETEDIYEHFQTFYHSLLQQDYQNFTLFLVYGYEHEKQYMWEVMMSEYPVLLEKTLFLSKHDYPSVESILMEYC